MSDYEIERLNKPVLIKIVKEQQEIINKAIEYIKGWQSFPHTNGSTHEELRNLKNILKGENNEYNK